MPACTCCVSNSFTSKQSILKAASLGLLCSHSWRPDHVGVRAGRGGSCRVHSDNSPAVLPWPSRRGCGAAAPVRLHPPGPRRSAGSPGSPGAQPEPASRGRRHAWERAVPVLPGMVTPAARALVTGGAAPLEEWSVSGLSAGRGPAPVGAARITRPPLPGAAPPGAGAHRASPGRTEIPRAPSP